MAGRKGLLVLLCAVASILAFAHMALADWSSQDDWYQSKKAAPKKHRGYYSGVPVDDEDDGTELQPYYAQPSPSPSYKPQAPTKRPRPYKSKPRRGYKPQRPPHQTRPVAAPVKPPPRLSKPPRKSSSLQYKPLGQKQPPPPLAFKPPSDQSPLPISYTPDPTYNPPASPASSPQTPSYTPSSASSQQQWLDPHNAARAELGLPPMVWSSKVAQYAESWANQRRASGCGLQHSDGPYGENIFWGSGGGYGPAECVAAWVSEKQYYNYADNSCAPGQQCGHYTQIVWATSLNLGCAQVQCDSGQVFMTCNYDPPGNWIGSKPY